jgi:hypothetical protein
MRVFSFGGGVQSTACLVLAAQGRLDYRTFLFSNTGDDSEHPGTLRYMQDVAIPYAEANGLTIHVLHRMERGKPATLYNRLVNQPTRKMPIPSRMSKTGKPNKRICTMDFKTSVIKKWLRENGATKARPAHTGIGISLDEWHRMKSSDVKYQVLEYPLVDMRIDRNQCERIIEAAGLPVPPKSACWFCPFHTLGAWQRMASTEPELFQRAIDLERFMAERQRKAGHDPVYLSSALKPLHMVATPGQMIIDADDSDEPQFDCGPFICPNAS